jgi:hypothetical protein
MPLLVLFPTIYMNPLLRGEKCGSMDLVPGRFFPASRMEGTAIKERCALIWLAGTWSRTLSGQASTTVDDAQMSGLQAVIAFIFGSVPFGFFRAHPYCQRDTSCEQDKECDCFQINQPWGLRITLQAKCEIDSKTRYGDRRQNTKEHGPMYKHWAMVGVCVITVLRGQH